MIKSRLARKLQSHLQLQLLALNLFLVLFTKTEVIRAASPSLEEPFESSSFTTLNHKACVSLYHRNGRIGCGTSSRSIQSGTIIHWSTLAGQVEGDSSEDKEYVAVISDVDYTYENINAIQGMKNLNGIVVVNVTSPADLNEEEIMNGASIYPQGMNTPEEYTTLYPNTAWNTNGDGSIYLDYYGIPQVLVQDGDVSSYLNGIAQDDPTAGDIVAEFDYYMGPDGITSKDCLEWKDSVDGSWSPKCLPLGGQSIWALLNGNDNADKNDDNNQDNGDDEKEVVWITGGIDATSMFHDAVPGLNTAAVNTLVLLLVSKILGELDEDVTSSLQKNIGIAFFQGENYGYLGSRNFWSEYGANGNFNCENYATDEKEACLNPLRSSLDFTKLGNIANILSVDQVGYSVQDDNTLYVHGTGGFVDEVLLSLSSDELIVQESSLVNDDDNGGASIPPSPLATALMILGDDNIDGSVLSAYDDTFHSSYMTHFDNFTNNIDIDVICQIATLIARTALALAYDDGSYDSDSASEYALTLLPDYLSSDNTNADDMVQTLRNCLFYNGNCDLFLMYANMGRVNQYVNTGKDWGIGTLLGKPPTYYVSVFDAYNSQPFVSISNNYYGAYSTEGEFGNTTNDAFLLRPSVLEGSIFGLLNHFLTSTENIPCESYKDCSELSCGTNVGTCTGAKSCTCPKAHYHLALDTNLQATKDEFMGRFNLIDEEDETTPIYTEPYWSSNVGVTIYRKMDSNVGYVLLSVGLLVLIGSFGAAFWVRKYMFTHKLY